VLGFFLDSPECLLPGAATISSWPSRGLPCRAATLIESRRGERLMPDGVIGIDHQDYLAAIRRSNDPPRPLAVALYGGHRVGLEQHQRVEQRTVSRR
jgi:hypothetical protein